MLLPSSHSPFSTFLLLLTVWISACWNSAYTQGTHPLASSNTVVGVRSHGVATISSQPKAALETGRQSLAKSLRNIEEGNDDSLENSILPRTRSRIRARMSKSDPPQVQTDALKEEIDEMIAEESIGDPVSLKIHLTGSRLMGSFGQWDQTDPD
jgi:hypothetical protein